MDFDHPLIETSCLAAAKFSDEQNILTILSSVHKALESVLQNKLEIIAFSSKLKWSMHLLYNVMT